MNFKTTVLLVLMMLCGSIAAQQKKYSLWYNKPAPNNGAVNKELAGGFPYDKDWERWSLPIGNGYMGASIFGQTDVERVQISDKTLGVKSVYGIGGATNFMELMLEIGHKNPTSYKRELNLNDAVSTVNYSFEGVNYTRSYFADYPDNVIVIKLSANRSGKISFVLRPKLPYLHSYNEKKTGRTGKVSAINDLITLSGKVQLFDQAYEGQIKVIPTGGKMQANNDAEGDNGTIEVKAADSVVILIAARTSYKLKSSVFTKLPENKFKGNEDPHNAVLQCIDFATKKGYAALLYNHLRDYQLLFNRVNLNLTNVIPEIPTDSLLHNYQKGKADLYLDELLFQYGRYLLIATSRPGSLPPHLQGVWSQYEWAPWGAGYWHNVNIQMNYWPAFNTNLAELFTPYVEYNEAFRNAATEKANEYIKKNNPALLSNVPGENGWFIGTIAYATAISGPSGHSGPGTGGFTTKLFWDYYEFTWDKTILQVHAYPAILGMAKFLSKTLKPSKDGYLLVDPSASPEQKTREEDPKKRIYYSTIGSTFDQRMVWENFHDLLQAAKILKIEDPFVNTIAYQIEKLDPILIGESGQIKEFREEKKYGDIGDPLHRHISHLCTLYPGTLINSEKRDWMKAAMYTLEQRGDKSNGWAMAHRLNLWARTKDGNRAYKLYQQLITTGILENLWDNCLPFQIDGNFGGTSGVAEMLLQSHEGYIVPIPAIPQAWATGSYKGLVARGNFVVNLTWKDQHLKRMQILSRAGGDCQINYKGIGKVTMSNSKDVKVPFKLLGPDRICFATDKGETYHFEM